MARREGAAHQIGSAALRQASFYRLELVSTTGVIALWALARAVVGARASAVICLAAGAALVSWRQRRHWCWEKLRGAQARRQFLRALVAIGFDDDQRRMPVVTASERTLAGPRLQVRVPAGLIVAHLEAVAEATAAAMAVAKVRVLRDRANASRAQVTIVERDPLSGPAALPWSMTGAASTNLWVPVPVGVDEDGDSVGIVLPEHNLLLGGEPGGGKSAALSLLLAASALDPAVTMWLLDGKQVELAPWVGCAQALVGPNLDEAIDVLVHLQAEMDLRYAQLLAWRRRKTTPGDGLGLHVVACDELAFFLAAGDRKDRDRCAEVLRDLVARGRAAGIIVLAATQKPSSDIVPTSLRDLFGYRWALRCATREASDTVLGSGWSTQGYSAAEIDPATRGVGFLLHEGGLPVRLRAAYLDDETIQGIAERATQLRNRDESL